MFVKVVFVVAEVLLFVVEAYVMEVPLKSAVGFECSVE